MTEWLFLAAAVVLTLAAAVFVAAEFSLVALDKPTVQRAVDAGDTKASGVLASLSSLSTSLSAAQVGITITTLLVGFIAEPSLGTLLTPLLRDAGLSEAVVPGVATGLALLIATLFAMVVGELVPQFLGISAPLRTAKVIATPVRLFGRAARPAISLLNGSANAVLRAMGIEPREELSAARTPQELASLVRHSAEAGVLDVDTARLLTRSLRFTERHADDVMTPRVHLVTIERTASVADVLTLSRRSGHSRFPVTGEDLDDIEGVVHVKRALAVPHERRADVPVSALMVDALYVPETIGLDPLLLLLREQGFQLAVVVDEYGGTSGVVTLEDVIEEIVGEVADEHDRSDPAARPRRDGTWSVPGLWRPDEVRDRVGVEVPDAPTYETLGGWVMAAVGRIPEVGDEVRLTGWTVTVEAMDGRRVERVAFRPDTPVDHTDRADHDGPPDAGPGDEVSRKPRPLDGRA